MKFKYCLYLFGILLMMSCTSYKSLVNYSEPYMVPDRPQTISNYQPLTVKANDILQIKVSSTEMEAALPFNLPLESNTDGYLVNSKGEIDFPTLGTVFIKGLEVEQVKEKIANLLKPYFQVPPIVQARLINFKVNVNGEVKSPGTYRVDNDRLTLIEAVTLAGDFTYYSARDSVLVIREVNGERAFGYVNFNSSEVFESPYFYLQQNDVIYVKPSKNVVNTVRDPATRILPWLSAGLSFAALIVSLNRLSR